MYCASLLQQMFNKSAENFYSKLHKYLLKYNSNDTLGVIFLLQILLTAVWPLKHTLNYRLSGTHDIL